MAKLKERIILNSDGTKEVVRMNGNVIEQIKTEDGWKSYDEVRHPKTKELEKPTNTTIDNTIINTTSKTENDNKIDLGDNNSSNRFVIMNTTGGNIENKGKNDIIRVTPLTNKKNNPQQSKQINKSSNKNNTKSVNKIVTKKADNNKQVNVNKPVKNKVLEQRNEILKKDNITDNTNTTLNKSTKVNTSTKTNVSRNKPVSKTNTNTTSANKDNNKGFDWFRVIKDAINNYVESASSYKPAPYKRVGNIDEALKKARYNRKHTKEKGIAKWLLQDLK
uniref:Uncharacterized protein n=1 Tax=Geladintestivirus 1 TaxID=3233133 RepID=A0AAU8MIF1_9CAUD